MGKMQPLATNVLKIISGRIASVASELCGLVSDVFLNHQYERDTPMLIVTTISPGTTEHSLSNWTSQKIIWDHVDKVRGQVTVKDAARDNDTSLTTS